jgi:hypothetical protein
MNNAINPQSAPSSYAAELMPCRSGKIKKVVARDTKDGIGGMTQLKTGTVYIPTGDNAKERTIRYHEALHASHTSSKAKPKDMLDQALEDARLHRYCSKSAVSQFTRARRDELTTALLELRQMRRKETLGPIDSLVTLRAMGILRAGEIKPAHSRLLDSALARLGKKAATDFAKALALLADISNWNKARKALRPYFGKDFAKNALIITVPSPGEDGSKGEDNGDSDGEDSSADGEDSDEDGEESSGKPTKPDMPLSEMPMAGSGIDEDDTDGEDEESTGEIEPAIAPSKPPKVKKSQPDEYTANLTPDCDKSTYNDMQAKYPMKLFIRRLDMASNRVRLSMGRKAPLPVVSGQRILARKLAGALVNPGMRVFARAVAQGGNGTILIDASGSMSIPEQVLIEFLSKAPALTLAFYNAPDDSYKRTKRGNIYIYAANGYRASMLSGVHGACVDYGGGNLIDYQALAWLLKQPSPRYIVTDSCFTGPWARVAHALQYKLTASKDITVVRSLAEMDKVLEELK